MVLPLSSPICRQLGGRTSLTLGAAVPGGQMNRIFYTMPQGAFPLLVVKLARSFEKGEHELKCGLLASSLGVRTPRPIGMVAFEGHFFILFPFVDELLSLADLCGSAAETSLAGPAIAEVYRLAVKAILATLYQHGILFLDRTAYNFLVHQGTGEVYVLDFEDAEILLDARGFPRCVPEEEQKFSWNPDFF